MKRITILLALVLAVALAPRLGLAQQPKPQAKPATAQQQKQQVKQAPTAVEQQLLQLEHDWSMAWQKRDAAFLQKLFADEYLGTSSDGLVFDKAGDLANLPKSEVASFKLEDMKVHVYGNTAVVTGVNTNQGKFNGKDVSGSYRFTDVFVMRDGRWQVVATQGTKVPAPAPKAAVPAQKPTKK